MIIDLILDRKDGRPYSPAGFYRDVMSYSGIFSDITDPITRAMDFGAEADVKSALADYIRENEYSPAIIDYINSVNWIDDADPAPAGDPALELAADIGAYFDDVDPYGYRDAVWELYDGDAGAAVRHDAEKIRRGELEDVAGWLIENVGDVNAAPEDRARAAELLSRLFQLLA